MRPEPAFRFLGWLARAMRSSNYHSLGRIIYPELTLILFTASFRQQLIRSFGALDWPGGLAGIAARLHTTVSVVPSQRDRGCRVREGRLP